MLECSLAVCWIVDIVQEHRLMKLTGLADSETKHSEM